MKIDTNNSQKISLADAIKEIVLPSPEQYVLPYAHFDVSVFVECINTAVHNIFGLLPDQVNSKCGLREFVNTRFMKFAIMKDSYPNLSLESIGKKVGGGRDHATVLNGIRKHNVYLETEVPYRKNFSILVNEHFKLLFDKTGYIHSLSFEEIVKIMDDLQNKSDASIDEEIKTAKMLLKRDALKRIRFSSHYVNMIFDKNNLKIQI